VQKIFNKKCNFNPILISGPEPPTIVRRVSNNPSEITLIWNDPCDFKTCNNDTVADFYEIIYMPFGEDSEQIQTISNSSLRSATVENLQSNTRYVLQIRTTSGSRSDSTAIRYIRSDRSPRVVVVTGATLYFINKFLRNLFPF